MKAVNRYDGVNFRVLKKFERERTLPKNLDIVVISAKYGLIKSDDHINNYDMRMTKKRASELHSQILDNLKALVSNTTYKEIFVNLGKDYLPAIQGIEAVVACPVAYAEGRIGEKMASMKKWITRIALSSEDQRTLTEILDLQK